MTRQQLDPAGGEGKKPTNPDCFDRRCTVFTYEYEGFPRAPHRMTGQ